MIDNNFQAELHATDFSNVMFEHEPHSLIFFKQCRRYSAPYNCLFVESCCTDTGHLI
jgi:hypothetical protein